jgi:tRNA-2-methylthio-N6-dimethylallyladenosine synthase
MAQSKKEAIFKRAPHVDLVAGTSRFEDIADLLEEVRHGERVLAVDHKELSFDRDLSVRPRQYQAFVTVMRGCNKFCTFCIVPHTQGRERSRPLADIVDEVKRLVDDGVVEVTLLGQRVDTYGLDLGDGTTLASVLAKIHDDVPDLLRLGFITSHPNHMTRELARTIAERLRISRYLHLPVQSGSDRVLTAMNRGYTVDRYRRAVETMRAEIEDLSLATDWIVGFPGETEEDFESSLRLLRELDCQGSFVFKYSPRSGTRAFDLEDDVAREEKARRNQILLSAQSEISLRRNQEQIGKVMNVLVEGRSKRDLLRDTGRSDRNHIVCFPAGQIASGRMARIKITDCTPLTLFGEPIQEV